MSAFSVLPIRESRAQVCREILGELPDWFGIPEALEAYVSVAEQSDMFGCVNGGIVGGFVVVRKTSEVTTEIHVMAVRPSLHRRGLGSELVDVAARWAKDNGSRYLTVKTMGPSRSNAAYDATRKFYTSVGFEPIEEIEGTWPGIPCLLMIKSV